MDDIKLEKQEISDDIIKKIESFSADEVSEKSNRILERLFDFANFVEAHVVFLYLSGTGDVDTRPIIRYCFAHNKVVVVPAGGQPGKNVKLLKMNDLSADLTTDPDGNTVPDPARCRPVPVDSVEIAVVPGLVFDEKGARIGLGTGFYDKLIPKLPMTTRKVSLAFEDQIIQQVPKGSIDRHVDIIITEQRIIYKI
ncbi:MAG: 5-formyltetrahydrofolate cyclo-ligase [Thermodesulfobacteriota bacterium]|nr:5-formyltetrahydrofolate cyclo-ligase [Thermodesulfobacteriota bacterium]